MSIKSRLTMLVSLLLGVLVFQAALTYYFRSTNDGLTEQLAAGLKNTAEVGALSTELQKLRRFEKEFFIYAGNPQKRATYEGDVKKSVASIHENLTRMTMNREGRYTAAEVAKFTKWDADLAFYGAEFGRIANEVQMGALADTLAANAAIGPAKDRLRDFLVGAEKDGAERQKAGIASAQALNENRGLATNVLVGSTIVAFVIGLFALFALQAAIVRPIEEFADISQRLARGEMGISFPQHDTAEFAQLSESLERLRTVMGAANAKGARA